MKRFEFRLDSVLRLREVQLEAERAKLQQLMGEQRRLTSELEAVRNERREAKNFVYGLANLENTELRTMSGFLLGMDARAGVLRGRLDEMARSVEQQRQVTVKAEGKVRLLEKLRQRKLEAWKYEADREVEAVAQEAWLASRHLRRASQLASHKSSLVAPPDTSGLTSKFANRNPIREPEVDEKTREHVVRPDCQSYVGSKVICAD